MRKLYEKKRILFAILCIVLYCIVMSYLKGNFGYQSIAMLVGLTAFAIGIILFVKRNHLDQVFAVLSMILVGFVEEMLFRGFLFTAMIKEDVIKNEN